MHAHLQSLKTVRAIAEETVRNAPGDFAIAAVLPGEAHGAYAEVLVVGTTGVNQSRTMIIGVDRSLSAIAIREAFAANLLH